MKRHFSHCPRLGTVLVLLLAATATARAGDGEFYVNTYRSIGTVSPMSGRSRSMGRSGRGLADGVASLGVNPAALGAFTGTESGRPRRVHRQSPGR